MKKQFIRNESVVFTTSNQVKKYHDTRELHHVKGLSNLEKKDIFNKYASCEK